jgi:uncharacterized protein
MEIHNFTPLPALLGGLLIGLSASIVLLAHGKIAGISGIVGGLLQRGTLDRSFRIWFLGGILAAGAATALFGGSALFGASPASAPVLAAAGLLVGFGTRLGNGCTSGHGVCGISRLSARSGLATITFITAGVVAVFVTRHVGGAQ